MLEKQKYNIGLDIGTNSVGWAVVGSNNFNVIRKGNKKLWGVRLFDEAQTAASRRLFRSARRRFDRRRERIKLLREIFEDEINKVDSNFFTKMKESFYNEKDTINKTIKITKQEKELIKQYNKKYPTIYHLRSALMESQEKIDVRLLYLGLHHIIKNRGNFLYAGDFNVRDLNIEKKVKDIFINIVSQENSLGLNAETVELIDFGKLSNAFLETSKKDKELKIKNLIKDYATKEFTSEFTKLMIGNKANLNKLFLIETDEKLSVTFKGSNYEDNFDKLSEQLGENIEILEEFKELYDMIFLKELFKGEQHTSISKLMVSKYNTHKKDLESLKEILRNNRKEYNKIFRTKDKYVCSYDQYISNEISAREFANIITKAIDNSIDLNDEQIKSKYNKVLSRIANDDFMPRITDSDNGKYPYQLNKYELLEIIENQGKYYPFIKQQVNGTYKLEKLLTFRIPYYVGPLGKNTDKQNIDNQNYWMVRKKENVKITPYNFEEVVDLDKSAELFIKRMISTCTYLIGKPAIPANSILYSKFKVLNELKQIKISGQRLLPEQIDDIYKNLFLKTSENITDTKFKNYIKSSTHFLTSETPEITGYSANKKFANNMKPYIDFFGENGIFDKTNYTLENAEEIIEWRTIFEDNTILERKLHQNYSELSDEQIKKILSKKYKGWSHLSKELLTTKYYLNPEENEKKSIMDLLETTNENFMQIINNPKYKFQNMIDSFNSLKDSNKLDYSVVAELATSPANKRGIYQALKVVDEIVKYMGYEPENIMVEMTRENREKIRTQSRKEKILEWYKNQKSTLNNYETLIKEVEQREEKEFNDEKLYLYFLQEGKSLYSGIPLDINNLSIYEVDHIIPRTLIKDDSIDNKALVLREENQEKAASFILPKKFRTEVNFYWWDHLKKCGLMSDKKIGRLKRYSYSEEDINGFINRQIVETSQIVKHVANILKNYYKHTNVIYLKASLSTEFRKKFEQFKFRDINNFHHMHDAYLAVTMGYYVTYFLNKKKVDFDVLKEENYNNYKNGTYKYQKKYGYVVNNIDPCITLYDKNTGEVIVEGNKFVNTVIKNLHHFDGLISKKTEIKAGEFFEQNISKKGTKGASLHKGLDYNMYGSYSGKNPSYAVEVNYEYKGKENQKMIGIPIYIDKQSKNDKNIKINYIKDLLKLNENDRVTIIKDKIPFNTLLNWEDQICYLVGATDTVEVCNAKEFIIDSKHLDKWKYTLSKLLNNQKFSSKYLSEKLNCSVEDLENIYNNDLSEIVLYIANKVKKEYKLYENLLPSMEEMFKTNNIDSLTMEEKEIIIKQMFNLLKTNSLTANLKGLNSKYSMAFGRKHHKNIPHATIINKSVTGIYEVKNEF